MNNLPKPAWLTYTLHTNKQFDDVKQTLKDLNLVTVCEESKCPNMSECWSGGTATFMIMGDTCTRGCKFCNVKTALKGKPLDPEEPQKLLAAINTWKLDYVVLTSVDRDDLADQGATHFAKCITALKSAGIKVEVLIPDFRGNENCIQKIIDAQPDVIAHNVETVERLQKQVRDLRAAYEQSLNVLAYVKKMSPHIYTKSSLMVGHGETFEEIIQTMKDLRAHNVDILTIGQYLRPSYKHKTVTEYIHPDLFETYKQNADALGFLYVAAGPYVRSSYRAGELFMKNKLGVLHV